VINDNDFGVAHILVNTDDGTFSLNYVPKPIQLGIIETRLNGLRKRQGRENPDGIASLR
jgi:hypothetical protein